MGLRDFIPLKLNLKLKGFRLRRVFMGNEKRVNNSKPSWMTPISHGYHVVESKWYRGELNSDDPEYDSVVVQREQFDDDLFELWFFQISDSRIGDGVAKLMQSHFFDLNPKRQIRRKGKEAMKKAYMGVTAKIRESQKENETSSSSGSVSVMIINGDTLVIANFGDYKAVLCKNGVARRTNPKKYHPSSHTLRWPRTLISAKILGRRASSIAKSTRSKRSDLVVGTERVDSDTEFLILASTGIWEAMKPQEAVSLISHLGDPQEAAECLAREAIARVSKSNISCLVIRFD